MAVIVIFFFLSLHAIRTACHEIERPNIVLIVADDIGRNDISFQGSDQIITENIDMLAYKGVVLEKYYSHPYGTGAISAMLSGIYPMKMGTQGPSIGAGEDRGVPLSVKLLPSYLKDLGYESHLVGKWLLGKSRPCYLPMRRGYETFYGFTCPVDYFTYIHMETCNGTDYSGSDFYNNYEPVMDQGRHITSMLTDRVLHIINNHNKTSPLYLHMAHAAAHVGGGLVNLQAPGEHLAANAHIMHSPRRSYAALVTEVDLSVGKIVEALGVNGLLHNTIIAFIVENGASSVGISRNYGCNLPLRGSKGSPWEGAVRTTAVIWYAPMEHMEPKKKIFKGMFHVTDWLPTLLAAAGGDIPEGIDGINQWGSIAKNEKPKRHNAVIAVDDVNNWGAYRDGDFKIIVGTVPNTCGYYGEDFHKLIFKTPNYEERLLSSTTFRVLTEYLNKDFDLAYALEKRDLFNLYKRKEKSDDTAVEHRDVCIPTPQKGCLYNITADPEESHDLWDTYPLIAQHMSVHFRFIWADTVPRALPTFDIGANPANHNYVWLPWKQDDDEWPAPVTKHGNFPKNRTSMESDYFARMNLNTMEERILNMLRSMTSIYVESVGSYIDNDN